MAFASTIDLPRSSDGDSPRLRKAFGLRTRFVIILLIAPAPSALLLASQGSEKLQDVRLEAQQRVLEAARETAEQQHPRLGSTFVEECRSALPRSRALLECFHLAVNIIN